MNSIFLQEKIIIAATSMGAYIDVVKCQEGIL